MKKEFFLFNGINDMRSYFEKKSIIACLNSVIFGSTKLKDFIVGKKFFNVCLQLVISPLMERKGLCFFSVL